MQSKAPLFSKAIIYKNLQRFWPIFAAYTLFVSILSLGMVMNTNYERLILPGEFMNYVYSSTTTLSVVIALFSIAIAVGVFAYMHNTVPTAMVNALPYKRQTMFFSNYLSGLLMILIPLLLFFLILIGIGLNYNCLDILGLSKWLFIFSSLSVLLYSAAVTIGMLTGNIIAHIVFFGIANFFLIGIEALSQFFLGFFLYGYSAGLARSEMLMIKATPIVHTSLAAHTASIQTDWIVWLSYFLLGVLLTWLALKLYKNRKMENAGDVIAIRKLNPIFKYGITFCTSLALGMILIGVFNIQSNSFLLPVLLLLFAGMVGYFIAEMLLRKSYRVIGTYKGFIIYALLFTLVSMSFYSDWYGYANRLPDANKVQAVAFS
ncbi:MAG TPA: hypothetical protein VFC73_07355, partial [Syntrophomonadaceae bacterium]|nr:hypothetical protein [Syntrophomonadaceae bacterium]